jgi:DNA-directed RNA polymerase specialized sigma subunit
MNPQLIAMLIQNVIIPEVATAIRAHHNATGNMPTDEQVIAALNMDADRYIQAGEAWLAANPKK